MLNLANPARILRRPVWLLLMLVVGISWCAKPIWRFCCPFFQYYCWLLCSVVGDAFILVIIKTMHYNMTHTKDQYLHTNCLATLANMSSKFIQLHPYVCQRLIAFYSTLVKRHHKTVERLQLSTLKSSGDEDSERDSQSTHLSLVRFNHHPNIFYLRYCPS